MKKQTGLILVKLAVSLGFLAYLLYSIRSNYAEMIDQLIEQPKDWRLLAAAWGLVFLSIVLTFLRWYWLVRALDLPFRVLDSLRLGFLGFMFNFVSLGSVGGDLFKAMFLAREHPGRRAEAISTIVVDRVIGLYGLLLVACFVVLTGRLSDHAAVARLAQVALVGAGAITLLFGVLMWPGLLHGSLASRLCGLRIVGPQLSNLLRAAQTYRTRHGVLWAALGISLLTQMLNVVGIWLIAKGLPGEAPSLASHMLIVPMASLASSIPVSIAGLGVYEVAMKKLYAVVAPPGMIPNLGMIVAIVFRLITLMCAGVGVCFYLGRRREARLVLEEAREREKVADASRRTI